MGGGEQKVYYLVKIRLENLDAKKEVLLRGSMLSLSKMWKSTKTSWRVGRKEALKLSPDEGHDDGWKMVKICFSSFKHLKTKVEEILMGGRAAARKASAALQMAAARER